MAYADPEREREYLREYSQRPEVRERKRERDREYQQRPEVRERQRERSQRPEVKERKREYLREYRRDPLVKAISNSRSRQHRHRTAELNKDAPLRTWSASECQLVMRDDLTVTEMATLLGRTYGSVAAKRDRLRSKMTGESIT